MIMLTALKLGGGCIKVVGSENEDLCRHDKWLCMMYPRFKVVEKNFLSQDGAIFCVD